MTASTQQNPADFPQILGTTEKTPPNSTEGAPSSLMESGDVVASPSIAESTFPFAIGRRWIILLSIPLVVLLWFAIFQPLLVLPRIGLSPGFGLTNQAGERLTSENLRGRIVLYSFTYTNCVDPCQDTTTFMQQARTAVATMDTRSIPVELVTISFDPTRDTAQQLQMYAAQFEPADNQTSGIPVSPLPPWHFLTGEEVPLKYIIGGGFGVYYQDEKDGTFTFDPTFVLVDGAGIVRAKYRNTAPDLAIIQRDIELVAKEAVQSTGATRMAYEAAHLFLCYPK